MCDTPRLHGQAARVLGEALLYPLARVGSGADLRIEHTLAPEDLVVYLSTRDAAARVEAIHTLIEDNPGIRLIASMPAEAPGSQLRRVLKAGVVGLVLDETLEEALAPTALAVLAGQLAVPVSLRKHVVPKPLSYREKQVLGLVVKGLTNHQIADELFLAESTVKTHLSSAFTKLDTRNRAEAADLILSSQGDAVDILSIVERERQVV